MNMIIKIKCFGLSCCVTQYMVTNNAVLYLRRHECLQHCCENLRSCACVYFLNLQFLTISWHMGFVVLAMVIPLFWIVMPCSVIKKCQCFRRMFVPATDLCSITSQKPYVFTHHCETSGNKHVYCDVRIREFSTNKEISGRRRLNYQPVKFVQYLAFSCW